MEPDLISDFLHQNADFLDEYIMKFVDVEQLERWLIRKTQKDHGRNNSLSRWKFCVHADKRKMLEDLTKSLYQEPNNANVLRELVSTVACAVLADHWYLYLCEPNTEKLTLIDQSSEMTNGHANNQNDKMNTLTQYVAKTKRSIICDISKDDDRFPDCVTSSPVDANYILAFPIMRADNALIGVIELFRSKGSLPFQAEDEEITNSYLVWGGIALHYAELYTNLVQHRKLNTFLLTIVKSIFQDMVNQDLVIKKIMIFARTLVNADRTSLFLADWPNNELYAHIFEDTQIGETESRKEIRFPIGTGIAGFVAATGQALNIPDVYNDTRFNRNVDQLTGYRTRNLLCMPIFIRDKVIGVMQMLNKKTGQFTKEDEDAFATFAIYCGLALDHAWLYDKIRRSEQKNKVALEILSYHSTCTEIELEYTKEKAVKIQLPNPTDESFSPYRLSNDEMAFSSIRIIESMTGIPKIESDDLYRFTLTVRKNYRRIPYHNWTHGFSVAHSLYLFLEKSDKFTPIEKFSIYISGLCHDLDHRGTSNSFLVNSEAPLAALFSTSPLEHHHFKQTVSILQNDGHNILKDLSSDEYKKVLSQIKHCILATDLALFFPNKNKFKQIIEKQTFDWTNDEHKSLLISIAMTGADLNSTAQPWDDALSQVKSLLEEYYAQGDLERSQGHQPIPLMDRTKTDEIVSSQIGFLENVSIPCFEMITKFLTGAEPYLIQCRNNLHKWNEEMEKQIKEKQLPLIIEMLEPLQNHLSVKPITVSRLHRTRSLHSKTKESTKC